MSYMKDLLIDRIENLSERTGYPFEYLMDKWFECCEDGNGMEKVIRPYPPIVMDPAQARADLDTAARTARDLPGQIADQLMEAKLTPLQAQEVLVRAWARIQQLGTIRTPNHQPRDMSRMKDLPIDRIERIKKLSEWTGYTFEYLVDMWFECCEDGQGWSYFEGVTLELDW